MREKIVNFVKDNIGYDIDVDKLLEKPKFDGHGDFALPVFILAKELKKAPPMIAKEVEDKLNSFKPDFIDKIEATGPFVNFYVNIAIESENVLKYVVSDEIIQRSSDTIVIEYPSPNTNKSLHLGHVRNILLGNSLSKIFKKAGNRVYRVNLNNDRGIAICKAMLMYEKYGENKTPVSENIKSDKFVEGFYVMFEQKAKEDSTLEDEALKMLEKWEEGDKYVRDLWDLLMGWVFEGYFITYSNYKFESDKDFYESDIYDKGKDLVLDAYNGGVKGFKKDEENGAIYCDFENEEFGKKYLLRGNGTTLYMTQDLYLASVKKKEFKADKYIFIVGEEQKYHFNVLFELFDRMGIEGKDNNFHYSYGYVYDKDGKKFSSRKGNVVRADEIFELTIDKAKEGLKQKELTKGLDEKELDSRSKIIGYAGLAFSFLKVNPLDSIKYDVDKALSFEGETGPYVLYTYARIRSLLRKSKISLDKFVDLDFSFFSEKEYAIIKVLREYEGVLTEAICRYRPSSIANFLIRLSQAYNDFYQSCLILKESKDVMIVRLYLSDVVSLVIKDCLDLLDIETLEEM